MIRDPDIYDLFQQVVVVHSVRRVDDLAFREELTSHLAEDPLVAEQAQAQLHYLPTVTREEFHRRDRITTMIENGGLFDSPSLGEPVLDPEHDRFMMCGSMDMIKDLSAMLEERGFDEGSNA